MTPEIMRQYMAAHAPELEVVELPEAHTTEYISREWKVLPAQVAKTRHVGRCLQRDVSQLRNSLCRGKRGLTCALVRFRIPC